MRSTQIVVLLILLASIGCKDLMVEPHQRDVRALTAQERQLVETDNRFGLKLFRALNQQEQDDNLFISPLSISMALGMTLNGADGETRQAMEKTLEKQGLSMQEINEAYQSLMELLVDLDPRVVFQIANSIWYRQGFDVEQDFMDVNRQYFDAEVQALDFGSPEAVEVINSWVDEKTQRRIDKIIDEIGPDVVMYLINAIYFKGNWKYQFDKKHTQKEPFHLAGGDQVQVDMMRQEATLPYLANEAFQAIDLPYGDSLYSMTIFLPHEGNDVNDLAARLTDENWQAWTNGFHRTKVNLFMPRFRLEYETLLNDVLKALGMDIAFSGAADFTKINRGGGLYISRVIHKTFVEVNEEGTEAAAVTAVEISRVSLPQIATMRIDRPFVYAIRENHSGTILFIGKVMNPAG